MSKDDQITTTEPVDQMDEEFSQTTDYIEDHASDASEDKDTKTPPNLDDIRSAGL